MFIVVYDFGSSSVKTCLFEINSDVKIVTTSNADYNIYVSRLILIY